MKTLILAAAAVLSLGTGAAFAQGLPQGSEPPVYGSHAFPNQPYHNTWIFSRIFSHSKDSQVAGQHGVTAAKGG